MQEVDWLRARDIWFGLGPDRDFRVLQRFILSRFRVKIPIDELRAEINARNWHLEALEHDTKTRIQVDAKSLDIITNELAAERIEAFRGMTRHVKDFRDLMGTVLQKAKDGLSSQRATVTIDEARRFMETYLKVEQFIADMEVPLMPETDGEHHQYSNPAELARALLTQAQIADITVEDITRMREPSSGGKT